MALALINNMKPEFKQFDIKLNRKEFLIERDGLRVISKSISGSSEDYYDFEELPHRRGYGIVVLSNKNNIRSSIEDADWKEISFMSTNGAYNLRTDLINQAFQFSLDKNMKLMYNIH